MILQNKILTKIYDHIIVFCFGMFIYTLGKRVFFLIIDKRLFDVGQVTNSLNIYHIILTICRA